MVKVYFWRKLKKQTMKKLLTLLLAAGMLSIYSCGGGSESTEGTATESTEAPTMEAAPAEEAAPADTAAAMPADTAAAQ